ncbi:MAG: hypothetical protein LRS49_01100 [Desulfurococcales archaeon]|nr:hypothetical protein [Desulfurococcales archaeon]
MAGRPCGLAAVKLGGSLVTVKSRPYTIDWGSLRGAASQLAAHRQRGGRLVLVHGGGSFGHAEVERLRAELGSPELPASAAARVQHAMLRLATAVAEALIGAGLPASVHPAHTLCGCGPCSYKPLEADLGEGLTPTTYGDAIPCGGRTLIVSGDQLVVEAALSLGADCVLFAIDKPGVIGPRGEVLEEVSPASALGDAGGPAAADVTGGLRGKLEWAFRAAASGVEVRIVGGQLILKALRGEPVGTRVVV